MWYSRTGSGFNIWMGKMCAHTPFVRKSLVTGLDSNTPQGKPRDTKCFLKHSAHINAQINQSPHKRILWPPGPAILYLPVTSRKAGDTESKDKCFMWETEHKSAVKWSYTDQSWWWFGCRKKAPLAGNDAKGGESCCGTAGVWTAQELSTSGVDDWLAEVKLASKQKQKKKDANAGARC